MKSAIVLGSDSDIAKGIMAMLTADGWDVHGWQRHESIMAVRNRSWDLFLCCLGSVAPVGPWEKILPTEEADCFASNLFVPLDHLRDVMPNRKPGASVCFLAGSNPNMIMPGYFAYNVSKMALLKAVEQMDYETPDAKFFALGPGTILTKIHQASKGWENPKLAAAIEAGEDRAAKIQRVYAALRWAMAQPKEVIGGRNLCASDIQIDDMARRLREDNSLWKLRRHEAR